MKWVPYVADDIVMKFKMLDPYYRVTLNQKGNTSIYETEIKVKTLIKFLDNFCRLLNSMAFSSSLLIITNQGSLF